MKNFTIVAASMALAACMPAYVAEQMPNTDGERDIFSPAASAEPHVAAKARTMDCKPFARRGAQENEDAFARCTLVNERTQAQEDLKAARAEIARMKATAAAKPRPLVTSPFSAPVGAMPAIMSQSSHGASTRRPNDMAGVLHVFGTGNVVAPGARVCVFRGGAPVSVEVGGAFVPTLGDVDGSGVFKPYDCAPASSENLYVSDVSPGEEVEFIYLLPTTHRPVQSGGMLFQGSYRRARSCKAFGYINPNEMHAVASLNCNR